MRPYGALELITGPAAEPLTLTNAKDWLRITGSSEDTLITGLIVAARLAVENYLNRKLINQTWKYYLDCFPSSNEIYKEGVFNLPLSYISGGGKSIEIPMAPVSSITHLKTYDEDNAATTMSASDYYADTKGVFPRVCLKDGVAWPSTVLRPANGIEIQFVAGYGSASTDVPQIIIEGIRHTLVHFYDCRGGSMGIPMNVMAMLGPYRIMPGPRL